MGIISVKEQFVKLNLIERRELLEELLRLQELDGLVLQEAAVEVEKQREIKPCPHCGTEKVYKRGKQKGIQMYKCRESECSRWFSETTGTALYNIQLKDKWQSYLSCMEQGMPLKKIAKKLEISIQTSFDWRHKVLSSLEHYIPKELSQIIECDELELPVSEKGNQSLDRPARKRSEDFKRNDGTGNATTVQVVSAVQRNGEMFLKAVQTKRLTKEQIEKALEGRIAENTTLITDKHPSYKAFAKANPTIKHKTLLAKDHVDKNDKSIHLQKVNNTHKQLRDFLRPFNGVSSKYLQNYLNWFAYLDKIHNTKTALKQWCLTILLSDQAYQIYQLFKENAVLIRT
jgi:transposase-like protein